jgi:hypothetical protein
MPGAHAVPDAGRLYRAAVGAKAWRCKDGAHPVLCADLFWQGARPGAETAAFRARHMRSGQANQQRLEEVASSAVKGAKRVVRNLQCRGNLRAVTSAAPPWSVTHGQAASVVGVGGGGDKPSFRQPVDHALDGRRIHRGRPAKVILRQGADSASRARTANWVVVTSGMAAAKIDRMPLRHPAQDIADLVIQAIVFASAISSRYDLRMIRARMLTGTAARSLYCFYTYELGI